MSNINYKRLTELGVRVYDQPVSHVKLDELRTALQRAGINESTFNKTFGAQTTLLCEGTHQLPPRDLEATLEKLMSSKSGGTQLLWG